MEKKMPFFVIPEEQRKGLSPATSKNNVLDKDLSVTSSQNESTACLNLDAIDNPPHAFPSLYPPCCDYDPFPRQTSPHSFPVPIWCRTPATPRRISKAPLNMDQFIEDFQSKLHMRVPTFKRSKTTQSWCAGRTTVPFPAPLAAFVRCPLSPTSNHTTRHLVVRAPATRLHPFRSPSPFSHPTTLIPPQQNTPTRRKVASLPKRIPKNTSVTHRRGSPAVSEASPSPSRASSFNSRSSSFGDMTSDRKSSSSSSSSSTLSSAATTPALSSSELPDEGYIPPIFLAGADSQNELLYVSREILLSAEHAPFHFSFNLQPKQLLAVREVSSA